MNKELKSKFIIRNYTDLSDLEVLERIRSVMYDGRMSDYGKQGLGYCFATRFRDGLMVVCDRFNKRDTFYVYYKE